MTKRLKDVAKVVDHFHYFAPDGESWPSVESFPEEINEIIGRHDSIQCEDGTCHVWDAEHDIITDTCATYEEASRLAQYRATW